MKGILARDNSIRSELVIQDHVQQYTLLGHEYTDLQSPRISSGAHFDMASFFKLATRPSSRLVRLGLNLRGELVQRGLLDGRRNIRSLAMLVDCERLLAQFSQQP